ncbi:calmodulin-like protein 4a [Rhinichthys klamathensis goyatoka]|uniref:calmodulin-like protein 4a n=1 Tax=Rhinichthys klamathensis goyatoka TaxID=3034132 RepID=UPI0024B47FDF|nr:calmodulin-like protein 4a [Rhinichthys klamathensis goyatoka]
MSCTYCNRQYNMIVGSYINVPMTTRLSVTSKLQWTLVPTGNPEGVTLSLNRRNMAKFLTQTQIDEFKECFSLYDKKRKGKIEAKDLITVMRCLGTSPTFNEVDRHLQVHKIDKTGELDFSTFLTMMHRQMQQEDPKTEILEAMRMTDKHKKGYILASELRAKLTGLGEKLTEKEVDKLFKEANVGRDGLVHYEEFTRMVTLPSVDY